MTVATPDPRRVVTVIIPTYNDPRLPQCLQAVAALDEPTGWRIEVVVVDNRSDVPPRQLVESLPNATFIVESRRGSYAARNTGIAMATGEILAFTDSDCRPAQDWLVAAIGRLEVEPQLAAVAGRVRTSFERGRPRSPVEWWEAVEAFPQEWYVGQGFGVTANLVVRRKAGESVGWFDAAAQSGGDRDFGRRLTDSGGRLAYAPDAAVSHPARTTWRELFTKGRRTAKGHARLETVQRRPLWHFPIAVYWFAVELYSVVKRGLTHPELDDLSARVQYVVAGFIFRSFWFLEKWRWRLLYARQAARGTLE